MKKLLLTRIATLLCSWQRGQRTLRSYTMKKLLLASVLAIASYPGYAHADNVREEWKKQCEVAAVV